MTNYLKVLLSLFVAVVSLFATSFSYAAPTQRGFQIPLNGISEPVLDDLIANWRINVVRVQVGDNANMDGLTDAAYDAMMESQFQLLDSVLPLFASPFRSIRSIARGTEAAEVLPDVMMSRATGT